MSAVGGVVGGIATLAFPLAHAINAMFGMCKYNEPNVMTTNLVARLALCGG